MMSFGDIFYIDDREFVFLFADGDSIYAAIILGAEKTQQVISLEKRDGKRGTSHTNALYCYVELTTDDYTNSSANMAGALIEIGFDGIRPSSNKLNDEDLREIRNEIVESENLFKPTLVGYMKSIFTD
jgi:hypothetical protein